MPCEFEDISPFTVSSEGFAFSIDDSTCARVVRLATSFVVPPSCFKLKLEITIKKKSLTAGDFLYLKVSSNNQYLAKDTQPKSNRGIFKTNEMVIVIHKITFILRKTYVFAHRLRSIIIGAVETRLSGIFTN